MTTVSPADAFGGLYRKDVKTSIWRVSGAVTPTVAFTDIPSLLASVPIDTAMRASHPELDMPANSTADQKAAAPTTRFPEEQQNVSVPAYIWYVGKEADNDFHLILGSTADATATYMNAEVSGLPPGGVDFDTLSQARAQLESLLGGRPDPSEGYRQLLPQLSVVVTGSLFFDGDHRPGEVGPTGHQPKTVWEIHPITNLQAATAQPATTTTPPAGP